MTTKPDTVTASEAVKKDLDARQARINNHLAYLSDQCSKQHYFNAMHGVARLIEDMMRDFRDALNPESPRHSPIPGSTPPNPPAAQTPAPPASEQDTTPATDGRIRCECGHICPAPTPKAEPKPEDYKGVHNADEDHEHWPEDQPKPAEERVRWFRVKDNHDDYWRVDPIGEVLFNWGSGTSPSLRPTMNETLQTLLNNECLEEFTPASPAPKDAESVGEDIVKRMRERHDFGFDRIWGEAADTIEALRSQLAAMTERAEANHPQRKGGA